MGLVKAAGWLPRASSIRRRRRRSHKLAVILILAALAGLGGTADLGYVALKGRAARLQANLTVDIQAGQAELEAGKASLAQANRDHDPYFVTRSIDHFMAAKAHFLAASQLADDSQLLRDMERVPFIADVANSRHAAVDGIAGMGVAISEAGVDLAVFDQKLLQPQGSGQAARNLLIVLDEAHSALAKVRVDFARAQEAAAKVDSRVLPGGQQTTFVKARDTIASALAGLDEFERLLPALREILGGNGARNYLIEQLNPAELRAGGGFIGTYSLLHVDHGTFSVLKSGDAYDLVNPRPTRGQPGFIPQPSPYREVIDDGRSAGDAVSWSFVDSNIYPDFQSNAKQAETFVQPRLGPIDGVIAIDYYAVAKMLEPGLAGPLTIPGIGTVDQSTFIPQIMQHDIRQDASHKSVFAALAGILMGRISNLAPGSWPTLVSALNNLAATRHLQAYFNQPLVEYEIERVAWSGSVNPTSAVDYMMEIESNYYGNKTNYFLGRHYTVELSSGTSGVLHHTIIVDLVNTEPYGNEDRVTYKTDIRLLTSSNVFATADNLRRVKYANPAAPSGTQAFDGWLDVACCGQTGRAIFEYDTRWPPQNRGKYEIYWQKQPGTVTDRVDILWSDGRGHSYTAAGDLAQDRVIRLTPTGIAFTAGLPAEATVPSLNLG